MTWAFVLCAVTGCSAPLSPQYQRYRAAVQQRDALPLKRAQYYAENPEGSEADYHFRLGEAYLSRGEMEKAYLEFLQTVQLDTYHQRALLYLAFFVAQTDDDASMRIITRRVRQRDPTNPLIQEILALRSIQRGDLKKAEKQLTQSLQQHPQSLLARIGLSLVYQKRKEYARAIEQWQHVLAQAPDHGLARMELARCYWRANQREKAVEQYDHCLRLYPDSLPLRLTLAALYRQAGLLDRALAVCREAQRIAPDDGRVLVETARVHLLQGDADAALTCLNKVKVKGGRVSNLSPTVRQLISLAYFKKGDAVRAEAELLEGLKRTPDDPTLLIQLASVYLAQKKYANAITHCQRLLEVKPNSWAARFRLARAYELMGDSERAIGEYRRALVDARGLEVAWTLNNLAYLCAQVNRNLDAALRWAQKAYHLAPHDATILDTLGFVHYQRQEYDDAMQYLKRSKELSGATPTPMRLYHLALAYTRKGMRKEAAAELNAALRLNPPPEAAERMRELLETLAD
ncbi:MAG: tetratricopeptide repeat protein [Abditibacteriales bacterium]|nr:tetratricopeptide repeat protein [Abditibacteriales bacterium]MDW8368318.1 tetratricopeptide repeat protein [Abditibacteriales bacterium]